MDSIDDSPGLHVSLHGLIHRFGEICLGTCGRLQRLNRYLMGCGLILSVTPARQRADTELRLTEIAMCCGLLDAPGRLPADRPVLSPIPLAESLAGPGACP